MNQLIHRGALAVSRLRNQFDEADRHVSDRRKPGHSVLKERHSLLSAYRLHPNECANCFRFTTLRCSKCHYAFYCSKTCQRRDWNLHGSICTLQPMEKSLELEDFIKYTKFGDSHRNLGRRAAFSLVIFYGQNPGELINYTSANIHDDATWTRFLFRCNIPFPVVYPSGNHIVNTNYPWQYGTTKISFAKLELARELYSHGVPVIDEINAFYLLDWMKWRVRHLPLTDLERSNCCYNVMTHHDCSNDQDHVERLTKILTFLLEVGADPTATNSYDRRSPLEFPATRPDSARKIKCFRLAMATASQNSIEKRKCLDEILSRCLPPPGLTGLVHSFILYEEIFLWSTKYESGRIEHPLDLTDLSMVNAPLKHQIQNSLLTIIRPM